LNDSAHNKPEARQELPLTGLGRAPVVTWALLTANIVVWWAANAAGAAQDPELLIDYGAMFGPLIADGQYWRLFTAMFLHVGHVHLLVNGFGLFIFGRLVERAYGRLRFLIIYILAGLFGSTASYWLNSISIGAGASGAIFATLGALVAFLVVHRRAFGKMGWFVLTVMLFVAATSLLSGLNEPGIDNWAHTAGFAAGIALGLALAPRYRAIGSPMEAEVSLSGIGPLGKRWWVVPAAVSLLAIGTGLATLTMPDNPFSHVYRAERHFEQQHHDLALDEVDKALRFDFTVGEGHLLRGRIFNELGDVAGARAELGMAITWGSPKTRKEAITLLLSLPRPR